jgi:hypothetical protein
MDPHLQAMFQDPVFRSRPDDEQVQELFDYRRSVLTGNIVPGLFQSRIDQQRALFDDVTLSMPESPLALTSEWRQWEGRMRGVVSAEKRLALDKLKVKKVNKDIQAFQDGLKRHLRASWEVNAQGLGEWHYSTKHWSCMSTGGATPSRVLPVAAVARQVVDEVVFGREEGRADEAPDDDDDKKPAAVDDDEVEVLDHLFVPGRPEVELVRIVPGFAVAAPESGSDSDSDSDSGNKKRRAKDVANAKIAAIAALEAEDQDYLWEAEVDRGTVQAEEEVHVEESWNLGLPESDESVVAALDHAIAIDNDPERSFNAMAAAAALIDIGIENIEDEIDDLLEDPLFTQWEHDDV